MPSYKKQAFTLIELLIVIVILGILAGTVLAVINPQQLINKSKDEKIKETMRKLSLVLSAERTATGADRMAFADFMSSLSVNASVCNAGSSFRVENVPTSWISPTYCVAPGGFYLYQYTREGVIQPDCISTTGFTGRTYAINNLGVLKSTLVNYGSQSSSMQSMCYDFDNPAWTVE